jgi:hypothetical protein
MWPRKGFIGEIVGPARVRIVAYEIEQTLGSLDIN